jgi:hypothetical protein
MAGRRRRWSRFMKAMSWEFLELAVHLDLEILPIETDFWKFLPVAAVIQTFFAEV